MKGNKIFGVILLIAFVCVTVLNSSKKKELVYLKVTDNKIQTVLTLEETNSIPSVPLVGKSFIGFREALAFKESRGEYNCVNTLGYLGKYQFGKSTLKRFKIYNTNNFLKDSELQEDAFIALCSVNKWILRRDINRKVGKKINGILITESGILAASHLAGAGNVKKYLRSNGVNNFKDAYGSNIEHYLKKFAGYDTSYIVPNKNARI